MHMLTKGQVKIMNKQKPTDFSIVKKRIVRICALVVCALCVLTFIPSTNDPVFAAKLTDSKVTNYEDQIAKLNRDMENLKSQIKTANSDIEEAIAQKNYLDSEMNILIQKIDVTKALVAELQANIAQKDTEISDREIRYEEKYNLFKERLRVTHEDGKISYLEMLFGAASLSDFLSRVDRIGAMLEYDYKIMSELKTEKGELLSIRTAFAEQKSAQEKYLADLENDEKLLDKKKDEAANYLTKLKKDKATYNALLNAAYEAEEKLQEELQAYLKELAEKENSKYVGGTFLWPVPTTFTRISSYYGSRKNPITGRNEFHNGIDIPAGYGTNIYAANAGKVTKATDHWSYGNYIMIDHGGGYATLYAHCSKLLVSVGDTVKKGQIIAKVGSTGQSTGNHLHFSLYQNSAHTDPMQFYK